MQHIAPNLTTPWDHLSGSAHMHVCALAMRAMQDDQVIHCPTRHTCN